MQPPQPEAARETQVLLPELVQERARVKLLQLAQQLVRRAEAPQKVTPNRAAALQHGAGADADDAANGDVIGAECRGRCKGVVLHGWRFGRGQALSGRSLNGRGISRGDARDGSFEPFDRLFAIDAFPRNFHGQIVERMLQRLEHFLERRTERVRVGHHARTSARSDGRWLRARSVARNFVHDLCGDVRASRRPTIFCGHRRRTI